MSFCGASQPIRNDPNQGLFLSGTVIETARTPHPLKQGMFFPLVKKKKKSHLETSRVKDEKAPRGKKGLTAEPPDSH
jgi:hypothetical protein